MRPRIELLPLMLLLGTFACTNADPMPVEYYQPAYRALAPEPVYSRVMWSHLPAPIKPRSRDDAPFFLPVISFELPDSNLEESIEALAATMGYRWHYPKGVAKRPVKIRMEGTIEEVLSEIGRQARVRTALDHNERMIRVVDEGMEPKLPQG